MAGKKSYRKGRGGPPPKRPEGEIRQSQMVTTFGPGSMVSHEQWLLSFSVSSAWARNR